PSSLSPPRSSSFCFESSARAVSAPIMMTTATTPDDRTPYMAARLATPATERTAEKLRSTIQLAEHLLAERAELAVLEELPDPPAARVEEKRLIGQLEPIGRAELLERARRS